MKYLLSTGKTTENPIIYIKDVILINMLLLPKEVPYFEGGSEELIGDVLEQNLQFHITDVVKSVLTRIRNLFPNVNIELGEVKVDSRQVKVNININGLTETYEVKRFN